MLQIAVPLGTEYYDEEKEEFVYPKEQILQLEHSLISLSKWESKWHKPFLSKDRMTDEETVDYIRCMTLTQNVPPEVYNHLTNENIQEVTDYINDPMTATTFSDDKNAKPNREIVTAEIIEWWMITLNIHFECRKWHLNKLLALIKVCTIKNSPPKKMSQKEAMSQQRALNAARRKQLGTRG